MTTRPAGACDDCGAYGSHYVSCPAYVPRPTTGTPPPPPKKGK